ncbi:MAG: nitronate monooxygenase [Candidatus Krumholzibacteria bacterium]|nr:nitronate monooxygenase [Candidatus Krumholzibacteria bacterium]
MNMPELRIDDLTARIPVVQGGMGVGISLSGLAGAVAKEGGIGTIATAGIGRLEPNFIEDVSAANNRALAKEIKRAKEISGGGLVGVNIMLALSDYGELILTSENSGADIVFLSAGLPLTRPCNVSVEEFQNFRIKMVPKISSARAAKLIFTYWAKNFKRIPDAVVVEGPMAGGHIGFKKPDIDDPDFSIQKLVPAVVEAMIPFREKFGKDIPVIAAGGIYTGEDIFEAFETMNASGVMMGTRFVATDECDAHPNFKQAYVDCKEGELRIIDSPVGLPGRAILNQYISDVANGIKKPYTCMYQCIRNCDIKNARYCIALALTDAAKGHMQDGVTFAGSNAWRVDRIMAVKELLDELKSGYEQAVLAATT